MGAFRGRRIVEVGRGGHRPVACLASVMVLAAVGVGACDADDADDDATSTSTQEGTAPDEQGDDASGWPVDEPPTDAHVVDADLVARVLVELDVHLRDIHRAMAREGEVGEMAEALVSSVYTEAAEPDVLARLDANLDVLQDEVAVPRSAVVELGAVEVDCVDALVRRDLGPMLDVGDGVGTWQVTLVVVDDSDNGTAWRMARDEPGEQAPSGCD